MQDYIQCLCVFPLNSISVCFWIEGDVIGDNLVGLYTLWKLCLSENVFIAVTQTVTCLGLPLWDVKPTLTIITTKKIIATYVSDFLTLNEKHWELHLLMFTVNGSGNLFSENIAWDNINYNSWSLNIEESLITTRHLKTVGN